MSRRLAILALVAASAAGPGSAHIGSHEVRVRDTSFVPAQLAVDPGEVVTWVVEEDDHTITADDGAFRFPAAGTVSAGQVYQWTTPSTDQWVKYYCEIHPSMVGAIKVGQPPAIPQPELPEEVRQVPSAAFPTLWHATKALPARARVELAPGHHTLAPSKQVVVDVPPNPDPSIASVPPRITIIGAGSSPGDVTIDGGGTVGIGIAAASDGVRIRNLTMTGFVYTAVLFDDVLRYAVDDIVIEDPGRFGVRAIGGAAGRIARTSVTGASDAGVSLSGCPSCDALIQEVTVEASRTGIVAIDAGPIVVVGSTLRHNGNGIVLASRLGDGTPQRGSHIYGNTIEGNVAPGFAAGPGPFDAAIGAGVWLDGAWHGVVQANAIEGHAWNVLATGLGGPTIGLRVLDNELADAQVDLAWDGLGTSCYAGNTGPEAAEPSTEPPILLTASECGTTGPRPGAPYPILDVAVLLAAAG